MTQGHNHFFQTVHSNQQNTSNHASSVQIQVSKRYFRYVSDRNHGIRPPSEITDIVFANAAMPHRLLRRIQVCVLINFDAPQTVPESGGDPIGIAGVVVVGTPIGVDIAEVVRVARIN